MQRNPQYEAGFIRAVDHADPEDLLMEEARRARLRRFAFAGVAAAVIGAAIALVVLMQRDTPAKQLERGRQASARSEHQVAIVEFKRSLLGDPDQPAARFLLGQEYATLGNAKAAEIEFRKALELKYDPERTLPLLVASLLQQERYDKVVTTVNGATLASPQGNADLKSMLGSAYYALGNEAGARKAWKAATDFVPSHPRALLAEAKSLVSSGAFDEAHALLARIPSTAPDQDQILAVRGDIANATGRPVDAVTAYASAVKLDPGNVPLRLRLAQIEVDLGRFDDARKQAGEILGLVPDHPKALYIGARAAFGLKDLVAADDAITRSIQQAPKDGDAQMLAGSIDLARVHLEQAELHLREAVALMPKNIEARTALADFYIRKHEPARADETIAPLLAVAPGDRRVAGIVVRIALLQGDALRASKAYDQVDVTRPDNVDVMLKAASLKFAAGDSTGGFEWLRAAGEADPASADVDVARVAAFVQLRQTRDALAAWNVLARKQPDAARTFDVRSTIDLLGGDRTAARNASTKAAALDPDDITAVIALAAFDVDDRKVDDARNRLQAYIASHPTRLEATMALVDIERATPDRDGAVLALLEAAHTADPRSSRALQLLAKHYVDHGDPRRALFAADEGLKLDPGDPSLLEIAGEASFATGDSKRAIAVFKALGLLNTQSADYPVRLGTAELAAGNPEAALAAFRLALVRQPERIDLQRSAIGSLLGAGRIDEASRLLFEINRLAPKSPALAELDADVKLGQKRIPEAIDAYRRALDATPSPQLAIRAFEGLMRARQPGDAFDFLAAWLKSHPTDEAVRRFDGDAALRARDFARASDDFRVLLRLHPTDAVLLDKLAASTAQSHSPQVATFVEGQPDTAVRNASMEKR